MKIWKMEEIGDIYQYITVEESRAGELRILLDSLGEKKDASKWEPFRVQIIRNKRKKICDCPHFIIGFPVFNEKTIDILNDFLTGRADILPLDCGEEKYFLINVYNKVDCIDYDKAQCTRFEWGHVKKFQKFAFLQEKLINEHIFKIPEIIGKSMVFVSDEFRNRVVNSDLVGFNFIEVWDSEE